jgi:DNA-directed RNA polymerase subunit omega
LFGEPLLPSGALSGDQQERATVYQAEDSMMNPQLEQLLSKVDSKFTLVSLGATRARQINQYYNNLGEGLGRMVPPQVTSVARKPLSIAFEEIAVDKIVVGEPVVDDDVDVDGDAIVEILGGDDASDD